MKKISSRRTFFLKRVLPVLWFGILGFAMVMMSLNPGKHPVPPLFFLPFLFAGVIFFLVMKNLIFDLMDEVYDYDSYLIVKKGKLEDRIDLKNIRNINSSQFTNPPRITLSLREPCRFGRDVSFTPIGRTMPWQKNVLVEELIDRVDRLRK